MFATDAHNNPPLKTIGIMPADSHAPIVGPVAVLTKGDTPAARALVAYLKSRCWVPVLSAATIPVRAGLARSTRSAAWAS